jgi:hypothetical protein
MSCAKYNPEYPVTTDVSGKFAENEHGGQDAIIDISCKVRHTDLARLIFMVRSRL